MHDLIKEVVRYEQKEQFDPTTRYLDSGKTMGTKKRSSKKKEKSSTIQYAAIDIGSNAIRMVVAEHSHNGLHMLKKFRFPIRLGADVFSSGKISGKNLRESARTFKKFRELIDRMGVSKLRAVGTSALRDAINQKSFLELVYRKSGIEIEIIDGVEEARIIHNAVKREIDLEAKSSLLIDIGGGSIELTFSDNGMMSSTQSFPFGTVRTLEILKKKNLQEKDLNLIMEEYLAPLTHFLQSHVSGRNIDFAIGTGGNFEAISKLKSEFLEKTLRTSLSLSELQMIIDKLLKTSYKDRVEKLKMRPDRADVIIPASLIIANILVQAKIEKILIPHVGLKEGLIWSLANFGSFK